MQINDTLIQKLESLSKLKLGEAERASLKEDLEKIVDMFGQISSVDTDGIQPLRHMTDTINIMRADVAHNSLTTQEGLSNAPVSVDSYFAVPKVIE